MVYLGQAVMFPGRNGLLLSVLRTVSSYVQRLTQFLCISSVGFVGRWLSTGVPPMLSIYYIEISGAPTDHEFWVIL